VLERGQEGIFVRRSASGRGGVIGPVGAQPRHSEARAQAAAARKVGTVAAGGRRGRSEGVTGLMVTASH
jgi:hypothetical protein